MKIHPKIKDVFGYILCFIVVLMMVAGIQSCNETTAEAQRKRQEIVELAIRLIDTYAEAHRPYPNMKATIVSSNTCTLRDLPVGVFAEGIHRNQKDRRSIYVKVELRAAGGNVMSTHVFDLLDPTDQYPDHLSMDRQVNMIPKGSTINLLIE